VKQILYSSESVTNLQKEDLDSLLATSRIYNEQNGITGILLYDGRRFVQIIEGPAPVVDALYEKISNDRRHRNVSTFFDRKIQERTFGQWGMGYRGIHHATDLTGVGLECIQAPQHPDKIHATIELMKSLAGLSSNVGTQIATQDAGPVYRPTVLVIDDRANSAHILEHMLKHANFDTLVATSGKCGLALAERESIDLILLDIDMPEMNGLEVCAVLKSQAKTKDIPVIFVSAMEDSAIKVQAMEIGGVDYITKPIRMNETLARIRSHLEVSRLRQHLRVSLTKLEDKNERLRLFSRTLAHDLRGPLSAVIGNACLLQMSSLNEEDQTIVADIHEAGLLMDEIISSLLLMATTENGNAEMKRTSTLEVIQTCQRDLALSVKQAGGNVEIDGELPECQGNAPWLRRVFTNLISNAIKYGGKPPSVRIFAEPASMEGLFRFVVNDNGPGLSPEDQGKLFREFSRLAPNRAAGLGLGLVIVKHLTEQMGGKVGVYSEPNEGASFYVELPTPD